MSTRIDNPEKTLVLSAIIHGPPCYVSALERGACNILFWNPLPPLDADQDIPNDQEFNLFAHTHAGRDGAYLVYDNNSQCFEYPVDRLQQSGNIDNYDIWISRATSNNIEIMNGLVASNFCNALGLELRHNKVNNVSYYSAQHFLMEGQDEVEPAELAGPGNRVSKLTSPDRIRVYPFDSLFGTSHEAVQLIEKQSYKLIYECLEEFQQQSNHCKGFHMISEALACYLASTTHSTWKVHCRLDYMDQTDIDFAKSRLQLPGEYSTITWMNFWCTLYRDRALQKHQRDAVKIKKTYEQAVSICNRYYESAPPQGIVKNLLQQLDLFRDAISNNHSQLPDAFNGPITQNSTYCTYIDRDT